MLRQLKRNDDIGRHVDRLSVAGGWTESYPLRHPASFFIQTMTQALHHNLARSGEGNAQNDIAVNLQLPGFAGVLGLRFGEDLDFSDDRFSDHSGDSHHSRGRGGNADRGYFAHVTRWGRLLSVRNAG